MREILRSILAVAVGIGLGLLVTMAAGENPLHVGSVLLKSAFGSSYDLGMTLFYASPLIFTGLSVATAFKAGLFNIGAEGQLAVGALAAACVGILFPNLPSPIGPILGTLAAFFAGACWGAIPGWLRAYRGSHEVINTIMMNFVAAGLCSWVTLYWIRNTNTQNPESLSVGQGYLLAHFRTWFGDAPVSSALVFAVLCAGAVYWFFSKTVYGFELRTVGESESVAKTAGIPVKRARVLAMALSGGLAGLVGVVEVLGNSGKFKIDFSPGYGFIGIAVALLARSHPMGVVVAALLFGALHKGTADLDLETERVTRDVSAILQALVILAVSAQPTWSFIKRKKKSSTLKGVQT